MNIIKTLMFLILIPGALASESCLEPPQVQKVVLTPTERPFIPGYLSRDVIFQIIDLAVLTPGDPSLFDHDQLRSMEMVNRASCLQIRAYRQMRKVLPRFVIQLPSREKLIQIVRKGEHGNWVLEKPRDEIKNLPQACHSIEDPACILLDRVQLAQFSSKVDFRIGLLVNDKKIMIRRSFDLGSIRLLLAKISPPPVEYGSLYNCEVKYFNMGVYPMDDSQAFQFRVDLERAVIWPRVLVKGITYPDLTHDPKQRVYLAENCLVLNCPGANEIRDMMKSKFANPVVHDWRSEEGWNLWCGEPPRLFEGFDRRINYSTRMQHYNAGVSPSLVSVKVSIHEQYTGKRRLFIDCNYAYKLAENWFEVRYSQELERREGFQFCQRFAASTFGCQIIRESNQMVQYQIAKDSFFSINGGRIEFPILTDEQIQSGEAVYDYAGARLTPH